MSTKKLYIEDYGLACLLTTYMEHGGGPFFLAWNMGLFLAVWLQLG